MNRVSKQVAVFVAGMIFFFLLLGIAGRCDYNEYVISSMSQETYDEIVKKVGDSDKKIVEEYISNRQYYDSLDY